MAGARMTLVLLAAAAATAEAAQNATVHLSKKRSPIDKTTAISVTSSAALPALPLFLTLRRAHGTGCFPGRSTSPGSDGFNCYASWGLKLPPIGDNYKKNQTYDFETISLSAKGDGTLPRVATPGNTCKLAIYPNLPLSNPKYTTNPPAAQ